MEQLTFDIGWILTYLSGETAIHKYLNEAPLDPEIRYRRLCQALVGCPQLQAYQRYSQEAAQLSKSLLLSRSSSTTPVAAGTTAATTATAIEVFERQFADLDLYEQALVATYVRTRAKTPTRDQFVDALEKLETGGEKYSFSRCPFTVNVVRGECN